MLNLYWHRLLSRKLLKGMWLTGIYRRTGRNFAFFRGGGRGGQGRSSGAGSAGGGQAKLRPATGVTRGLHRFRQGNEQEPYHVGHGGVVVGGNPARLAVELGFDGYGDVSDGSHGPAFPRAQEFHSIGSVHHRRVIIRKTAFEAPGNGVKIVPLIHGARDIERLLDG